MAYAGVCLDWFRSYLEHRQMRVKCRVTSTQDEVLSDNHIVNYGYFHKDPVWAR